MQVTLEHRLAGHVSCKIIAHETESWLEGWKESFRPIATERFYIYPPWETLPAANSQIIPICIEPGMAFGTGQHATTLLCLEELAELERDHLANFGNWHICDVGTGTGILSIAASKIGVTKIIATDIDPDAVTAAKRNARDNQCSIEFAKMSVPVGQSFDLVIANILAVVLKQLMPDLAAATKPGGYLLMSGLLDEQAHELTVLAHQYGLQLSRKRLRDDWCALLLRKVS